MPKLYWRRTSTKAPETYDVVDGQQRLRAIWDFFDGKFKLPKDAEPINGEAIAGCLYDDLPDEIRSHFDVYPLDIVILEDTDEDEVREMFLRLQNGTSLKAQEKRNAFPGKMRDFVRQTAQQPFFQRVGFTNSRFAYDHIAAQLILLEMQGGPANIKNADLNKMYDDHRDFDASSPVGKAVKRVLDILASVFQEKTPELERYNVIALYCVITELLRQYVIDEVRPHLHDWFVGFEAMRRQQDARPEEEADADWVSYREKISHSTDAGDSIRFRMEFMLRHLLEQFPGLSPKDNQRGFTHVQKLAIFRRDKGICQLRLRCDGVKITWDDWHADHKVAWSRGGKSTVENGQVACPACNLAKGAGVIPVGANPAN
ncbi:MAG: HNH endonuclease [Phreatobacter sp.]|nr:HNH endonuclease [Phreatobacter sp.]